MTAQLWVVNESFKFISISSFIQRIQLRSIMSIRSNSLENNLFYFTIRVRKEYRTPNWFDSYENGTSHGVK